MTPYWAIGAVVFALLYVLTPVDLIPDVIPGVGMIGDAAVGAICLAMVKEELEFRVSQWPVSPFIQR